MSITVRCSYISMDNIITSCENMSSIKTPCHNKVINQRNTFCFKTWTCSPALINWLYPVWSILHHMCKPQQITISIHSFQYTNSICDHTYTHITQFSLVTALDLWCTQHTSTPTKSLIYSWRFHDPLLNGTPPTWTQKSCHGNRRISTSLAKIFYSSTRKMRRGDVYGN